MNCPGHGPRRRPETRRSGAPRALPRRHLCLRCIREARRDDHGVSLLEVMVAFLILMVVIVPLSYMLDSIIGQAGSTRETQAALQIADSWLEVLSNQTPPTNSVTGAVLTGTAVTPTDNSGVLSAAPSVGGTTYKVTATYLYQSVDSGTTTDNLCATAVLSANNPGVIVVQVKVSWNHDRQSVLDTTNLQYPQPGVQVDGFLAIQISGSTASEGSPNYVTWSNRVQAIPVKITNTSTSVSQTINPDPNGCVFDQVVPGTYTVQVQQPPTNSSGTFPSYSLASPAFVDQTYNSAPATLTETVAITQETTANITFDEGLVPVVSYSSATGVADGVDCPGAGAITCIATGTGSGSSAPAEIGGTSTWASGTVTGATRISQVACTTGSSPTCVGVGTGSAGGVIVSSTGALTSTPTVDTVPAAAGAATFTQVVCPSSDGCWALGTSTTGAPLLLAGSFAAATPIWQVTTDPALTFMTLNSIACTSATECELSGSFKTGTTVGPDVLRIDGDPGAAGTVLGTLLAPTFTGDTTTDTGIKSVSTVSCSGTTCLVLGMGDATSANDPVVLTTSVSGSPATANSWIPEAGFTTATTTKLTSLSCAGNGCAVIGTAAGAPAMWEIDLTQNPHAWSQDTLPPSVTNLSAVVCGAPTGSDLADCAATATGSTPLTGAILTSSLTQSSGTDIWSVPTSTSLPSSLTNNVEYFSGIACEAPSAGSVCAAVGSTPGGPFVIASSAGTAGTWSVETPSTVSSTKVSTVPLEVSSNSTNWTSVTASPSTGALGTTLYPVTGGYTIAAGDCATEAGFSYGAYGTFAAVPGSTPGAAVPLGVVSFAALLPNATSGNNAPVSGATVTLTATTGGCTADTYTFPATGADGISRSALPYGTYNVTIKSGTNTATVALTVGANSVIAGGTTYVLPNIVPVVI